MRKFIVTIDGKNYEVGVEEVGADASFAPQASVAPAAPVAPAPQQRPLPLLFRGNNSFRRSRDLSKNSSSRTVIQCRRISLYLFWKR